MDSTSYSATRPSDSVTVHARASSAMAEASTNSTRAAAASGARGIAHRVELAHERRDHHDLRADDRLARQSVQHVHMRMSAAEQDEAPAGAIAPDCDIGARGRGRRRVRHHDADCLRRDRSHRPTALSDQS
jgi:hypothetical protein